MYLNNRCAITIGNKRTSYFKQYRGVKQGCSLSPNLFNIYINTFAEQLQTSTAPGVTLQDTEVKCLMFADDLVLLSPSKEALQQSLDILHKFSQAWALTVKMEKTKILTFEKQTNSLKNKFTLGNIQIEHTKHLTYLGLNINSTGHFGMALNELKEKARRQYYKRYIVKHWVESFSRMSTFTFKAFNFVTNTFYCIVLLYFYSTKFMSQL